MRFFSHFLLSVVSVSVLSATSNAAKSQQPTTGATACELCVRLDALKADIVADEPGAIANAADESLSIEWSEDADIQTQEFDSYVALAVVVIPNEAEGVFADQFYKNYLNFPELESSINRLSPDDAAVVRESLEMEAKVYKGAGDYESEKETATPKKTLDIPWVPQVPAAAAKCDLCEKMDAARVYITKHGKELKAVQMVDQLTRKYPFFSKQKYTRSKEIASYLQLMLVALKYDADIEFSFHQYLAQSYSEYPVEFKAALAKLTDVQQKYLAKARAMGEKVSQTNG